MASYDYFTHATLLIPRYHAWSKRDKRALSDLLAEGDTKTLIDFSAVLNRPLAEITATLVECSDLSEPIKLAFGSLDELITYLPFNEMVSVLYSRAGLTHRDGNYHDAMMRAFHLTNFSLSQYAQHTRMNWRAAIYRVAHHFQDDRLLLLLGDDYESYRHIPFDMLRREIGF